jgi:hypothetical protein
VTQEEIIKKVVNAPDKWGVEGMTKDVIEISFRLTGDPWIDAGYAALWLFLRENHDNLEENPILDVDAHKLVGSKEEIETILNKAFEQIKSSEYIVKTGNKATIFNEKAQEWEQVDKIDFVPIVKALIVSGRLRVEYAECELPNEALERLKESGIKATIKEKDNKTYAYCSPPYIRSWIRVEVDASSQDRCLFCNRPATSRIHANNYPFLVTQGNWSNFYSFLNAGTSLCTLCELASVFAFKAVFFNIALRRPMQIFIGIPHASDIAELVSFWNSLRATALGTKLKTSGISNIFDKPYGVTPFLLTL